VRVKCLARLGRGHSQEVNLVVTLLERRYHRHKCVLIGDEFWVQVSTSEGIKAIYLAYFKCVFVLAFLVDCVCDSLLADVLHLDHGQVLFGDEPLGLFDQELLEALLATENNVEATLTLVGNYIQLCFVVDHFSEVSKL
jgi:hypothetical protein